MRAYHREDYLKRAQKMLEDWCNQTWLLRYKTQPFGAQGILPNSILTSLATCTSFCTLDNVCELRWVLAKQHVGEVLKLLEELDWEVALEEMAKARVQWDAEEAEKMEREAECKQERIHKMIEAAKRHKEKEAEKVRKVAEKVAEKEGEKIRKAAERETEKARKAAEKEAEKARKVAEKDAEKARKVAEKVVMCTVRGTVE